MHREVFADRPAHVLTVGEMPDVTLTDAVLFTDPARRELDMVFQFEHVRLDFGAHRYDPLPLELPALKRSLATWQEGLAERGWNSLYFGNHDQPRAVSRFGDDGAHRVASAKTLATVLHCHRGTPYVYQGDELGMANAPYRTIDEYRDIQALNFHADAVGARRRRPDRSARGDGPDEPRPRPHPGAVGRLAAGGVHDRDALARGEPGPRHGERRRPGRRP